MKTRGEHAIVFHTTKGSENTNMYKKEELCGNSSYFQNGIISRA
jgi:hypothetical protein